MSTVQGSWRGPNIVKDGLILYADAGSPNSYDLGRDGSTIRDISGNSRNGSLINSPVYSKTVDGMFTFNGTNQYINFGNSSSVQITVGTVSGWIKATSGNSSFRGIITKQNAWGLFLIDNILSAFDWGNYYASGFDLSQGIRSTGINLGTNTWTNVAMSFSQTIGVATPGPPQNNVIIYTNGSPVLTTTTLHRDHTASLQFAWANFSGQYLIGDIAQGLVYNRVLSSSEILNNFNSTRSRFGV